MFLGTAPLSGSMFISGACKCHITFHLLKCRYVIFALGYYYWTFFQGRKSKWKLSSWVFQFVSLHQATSRTRFCETSTFSRFLLLSSLRVGFIQTRLAAQVGKPGVLACSLRRVACVAPESCEPLSPRTSKWPIKIQSFSARPAISQGVQIRKRSGASCPGFVARNGP